MIATSLYHQIQFIDDGCLYCFQQIVVVVIFISFIVFIIVTVIAMHYFETESL